MKRKNRRLAFIISSVGLLSIASLLVLSALRDSIVFFYTPSDLLSREIEPDKPIRVGGLVVTGSVVHTEEGRVEFKITDTENAVQIHFNGLLPDLFREGQGVVAQGTMLDTGDFEASQVLAKHDETYMPPEVAEALKEKGYWQQQENK